MLISLVFAPISEEFVFRGILYRSLRDRAKYPLISALIVSFIFAVAHGTIVHLFVGFSVSLVGIILYERTGKISYSVFSHLIHNFLATGLSGLIPVMGFMYNLTLMIFIGISFILILIYLLYRTYGFIEKEKGEDNG